MMELIGTDFDRLDGALSICSTLMSIFDSIKWRAKRSNSFVFPMDANAIAK